MEQTNDLVYDQCSPAHEYPDPDSAAYATQYRWFGEDENEEEHVPLQSPAEPEAAWPIEIQDQQMAQGYQSKVRASPGQVLIDSDYEVSENGVSEDDLISDEESEDSTELLENFNAIAYARSSVSSQKFQNFEKGAFRGREAGRRGRRGRPGKGGKGIKRGLRKAIEPSEEFKALQAEATLAFVNHDEETAEQLILQAIQMNPEIFEAHNLLSAIHYGTGDLDKAIGATWTAAHTKPRDPEIWSRLAGLIIERGSDDRKSTLRNAIYCINRIINLEKHNTGARYQRASFFRELGYRGKAVTEYEELLKQRPHDTIVMRDLAEIYIELDNPERALEYYQASISHFQAIEPNPSKDMLFGWSDVNIVTELYGFQQRYDEGIAQLKSLSRWLLGRKQDVYWASFDKDDREWDLDDQPRRIQIPDFVPGEYDSKSYGDGLPLDLRIKLGIFRLKAQSRNLEEALIHFQWLDLEDTQSLHECTDLLREVADALRGQGFYHEALQYYKPLQQVSRREDLAYLFQMASCHKAVGQKSEAESCYRLIIERDSGNYEARTQLSEMHQWSGVVHQGIIQDIREASTRQHKSLKRSGDRGSKRTKRISALPAPSCSYLVAPRSAYQSFKQLAREKEKVREGEVYSLYLQRERMQEGSRDGDEDCKAATWMETTKALLKGFGDNKVFFPADKHHRFFGYSREARAMASKPKHELTALTQKTRSIYETADGQQIVVPDEYCGIPFSVWLDMFLEYALVMAINGNIGSAYQIVELASRANIFYCFSDSLFSINVCWFTCALVANDDETLCNVARWFMKQYQFVTDGYRLFSALNRLCDSENSWFNCGPSQKYILRQLKAVDYSLLDDGPRKTLFRERASYSTNDSNGNPIPAEDMDIALLMLYGHVLYAGKSYTYAVNYYLRALALNPNNSMIKLCLALGYLHYALKRQAESRHHILSQGLAFLLEYYDDRSHSGSIPERQEAEYNVARAYHLLGLTHLAIPYYERCLDLSAAVQKRSSNGHAEDIAIEAAVNLQSHWAASRNTEKAREVTEKWLVM